MKCKHTKKSDCFIDKTRKEAKVFPFPFFFPFNTLLGPLFAYTYIYAARNCGKIRRRKGKDRKYSDIRRESPPPSSFVG